MPTTDYDRALVRAVPQSYAPAYARKGIQIDRRLADAQHAAYVAALEGAGIAVKRVPAAQEFYDCVFVEDTAVVWGRHALITRMAEHRDGEQRGVAAALAATHQLTRLAEGARLEGGDVLHTEEVTYVGLSRRTNARGADNLAEFLSTFDRRVVRIAVANVLHLKTAATYLGNGALLAAPGSLDFTAFEIDDLVETAAGEEHAANAVRARDTLIVRSGYPATLRRVRQFAERHAVAVAPVDLSEFEKGDGSATCLSLLWREA